LRTINAELPSHERLSNVFVTPPWTIENELLTPTMKIKRKKIEGFYKDQIAQCDDDETVIFLM